MTEPKQLSVAGSLNQATFNRVLQMMGAVQLSWKANSMPPPKESSFNKRRGVFNGNVRPSSVGD